MMSVFADYEYLGYCQYGVPDRSHPSGVFDCREPAIARIWWGSDGESTLLVCKEHLEFIIEAEEKGLGVAPKNAPEKYLTQK